MVDYATIQAKIDRGKGKAARKLGQPFNVFRIETESTGDFPEAWSEIAHSIPVFRRMLVGQGKIETAIKNATLFYDIIGDMSDFVLGDVFRQDDPPYVPGVSYGAGATKIAGAMEFNAFGFAWHPPVRLAIGGRIDRRCMIYRPSLDPKPLLDGTPYWKSLHDGDRPLILKDGHFSFGGAGARGSFVPVGLSSAYRPYGKEAYEPAPPGMLRPSHWFAYLPPLPGYHPVEGDALITEDDARYVIVEPYFQEAGVVGSQLMLDRTGAETS